jgi:hypothetical protein
VRARRSAEVFDAIADYQKTKLVLTGILRATSSSSLSGRSQWYSLPPTASPYPALTANYSTT